jgi:transposase-like protein
LIHKRESAVRPKSVIEAKCFHDEATAFAWVESRVWPNGSVCPHCGGVERISKMGGKSTRLGAYKCYQCRKPFTVKVGTVFEASHVPMRFWLQAMYLMCSSEKGISSNQLHRTLGVTLKTVSFMTHRIREAMKQVGVEPMGGGGKTVEIDETVFGFQDGMNAKLTKHAHIHGSQFRNTVLTFVERGGSSRSFHVEGTTLGQMMPIICLRGRMEKAGTRQKRRPRLTDKKQSERFKETARKLGADENRDAFEKAFAKLVPAKRPKESS